MRLIKLACLLVGMFLCSCSGGKKTAKANDYDFERYKNKSVRDISYYDGKDENYMVIVFTDGSILKVVCSTDIKVYK